MRFTYFVELHTEAEGGYTGIVPSLPGCVTFGKSEDDVVSNAVEAIEVYIESLAAEGYAIPQSDTLEVARCNTSTTIFVSVDVPIDEVSKESPWLSTKEAAVILGTTVGRVNQLIAAEALDARKVGRDWSVSRGSVSARAANPPRPGRPVSNISHPQSTARRAVTQAGC